MPPAWLLIPSLEIGETYNDNVTLAPKGSEVWDVITTISPGLKLTGQSARVNVGLSYNPQELIFDRGTFPATLQQRLLATGKAELYRDALFFEASSSIDQQFLKNTGPIGATTVTASGNLTTVEAVRASPYLLQHLGPYANSETRYRFSDVTTSGGTTSAIGPQIVNEERQTFTSGEYFGRFSWTLVGDLTAIDRLKTPGDPASGNSGKDLLLRADARYPVYADISVLGGVGYERITDPTLIIQPKGVIWNAGLNYTPTPYFTTYFTYGRRFQQTNYEFHLSYSPVPALRVAASYTEQIQTGQSAIAANLGQLTLGPNGTFVNSQTGLPFVLNTTTPGAAGNLFGLPSGSFLIKRFQAEITATVERDTFSLQAFQAKQSGDVSTTASTKIVGAFAHWDRQLWPNLKGGLGVSYYKQDFQDGSGRADNAYTVSLGLTYNISPTASATFTLSRLDLESNIAADSLVNDVVMATIRKQF